MDLRETRSVPEGVGSPEALESFVRALTRELAPGPEDGALIVLEVRASEGSITLLVDNAPLLKPAWHGVGRWTYLGFGGVLSAGFAAGSWTASALFGTLISVSVLVGWVTLEIGLQRRKEQALRARPLDVELWRERFDSAIASARAQVVSSSSPP